MTDRIDALRALEKAVEAGCWDQVNAWKSLGIGKTGRAERAFNGSLDAAKALHEAMLPGVAAVVQTNGTVQIVGGAPEWERHTAVSENNPARAWLLAIIRALIAKGGGK